MPTSSTATPRRTDPAAHAADLVTRHGATAIATAIFAVLLITFKPFNPTPTGVEGGDIVNQLGFGSIGALSIFALLAFGDPRRYTTMLGPSFLVMIGFLLFSVLNAADPPTAMRAATFTLIGILAVGTVIALPRDAESFSMALFVGGMSVVLLSYFGIFAMPGVAIHSADAVESQHAGLWRGVFSHKNIAGPVMACLSFCGLYLWRRGWTWRGGLMFALAMFFMIHTGSKTTAGLVPLAMLIVAVPAIFGMRGLTPVIIVAALVGTGFATLGIVFIAPLKAAAAAWFPDLTYTGRTTLWEFAGEMLAKRPWTGYGFESFWGTSLVMMQDNPFDRAWDIRPMVHGHNGYIDIAVIMGIPALVAALWAFFIAPLRDFMRTPMKRESIYAADLFLMILLFTGLNAFLESFFFRRADPVWLFFVFGIIGLRLTARLPVVTGRT